MIDIHSHILPGIDDGAENVEISVELLKSQYKQGITTTVATPHFYPANTSVENFIQKRNVAFDELKNYTNENQITDIPNIILGAEIHFSTDICNVDIRPLLIENTNFALFELPYNFSGSWVVDSIFEIIAKYDITPIMAHIERYVARSSNYKHFDDLFDMNIYFQVNADSVNSFKYKRIVKKLIKNGNMHFLASDAHNLTTRSVRFQKAIETLEKKFGPDFIEFIDLNAQELIQNKLNLF